MSFKEEILKEKIQKLEAGLEEAETAEEEYRKLFFKAHDERESQKATELV